MSLKTGTCIACGVEISRTAVVPVAIFLGVNDDPELDVP